jgi:ADP-ribose pyrophosphatase
LNKLTRYLSLVATYPAMFENPWDEGFSILLEPSQIEEVQSLVAQRLSRKELPTEWAEVGVVYEDEYILILRDAVRFPNGKLGTYFRLVLQPAKALGVVILPIYDNKVLLIRHFRHATRNWHLEIPRGFGEPGLSSYENAKKELMEEIGAEVASLTSLGAMHVNTGISSECVELFYAEIEAFGQGDLQEGIQQLQTVEVWEFEKMIRDNEITDSFTIAAYTRAKLSQRLS